MTTFDETLHPRHGAGSATGGQFATKPRAESGVALAVPGSDEQHWVAITRFDHPDLAVGPYPSEQAAQRAMEDSLLVEGICEEDCDDAFLISGTPDPDLEQVIVDLRDPHHSGVPRHKAYFQPQAWVRDEVVDVDPQGPTEWDVTDAVAADGDYWRELLERTHPDTGTGVLDSEDRLQSDPSAPQWVRDWKGPFSIRVEEDWDRPADLVLQDWLSGEMDDPELGGATTVAVRDRTATGSQATVHRDCLSSWYEADPQEWDAEIGSMVVIGSAWGQGRCARPDCPHR